MAADLIDLATRLGEALTRKGWTLAVAESCTGGGLAAACTAIPGSSAWFDRGFVTYSNRAKTEMLGVPAELIERHGAVSEDVAREMAEGALNHSDAQLSVAITGIAGPSGGSRDKPVGTVWIAVVARDGRTDVCRNLFRGDRADIRHQSIIEALRRTVEVASMAYP